MPEFIYHCPHCGQKMECDSEQFDGTIIATCPKCNQEICPEYSGEKPQQEIIKLPPLNTSKKQMRNFVYECRFCKQKYECDEPWIGAKIRCQTCGQKSVVRMPGKAAKKLRWLIPTIIVTVIVAVTVGFIVLFQNNNGLSLWVKSIFDDSIKDDNSIIREKMFHVTGERTFNWTKVNMNMLEPKFSYEKMTAQGSDFPDYIQMAEKKMVDAFLTIKNAREESVKLFNKAMQIAVQIKPFDNKNENAAFCLVDYYRDEKADIIKQKVSGAVYLECCIESTKERNSGICKLILKINDSDDEIKLPFFVFQQEGKTQDEILVFSTSFAMKMLAMRNHAFNDIWNSKTESITFPFGEFYDIDFGGSISLQYNKGEKRPYVMKIHNQCGRKDVKYTLLFTRKNFVKIAEAVAVMEDLVCEHNITYANIRDFYQVKK